LRNNASDSDGRGFTELVVQGREELMVTSNKNWHRQYIRPYHYSTRVGLWLVFSMSKLLWKSPKNQQKEHLVRLQY